MSAAGLYEVGAITGRKFQIMAANSADAQREAVKRMSPFEAGWGVMSVKLMKPEAS